MSELHDMIQPACAALVGLFREQGEEAGVLTLTFRYKGTDYIVSVKEGESDEQNTSSNTG